MKSTVTGQEVNAFNPNLGPCCHPAQFRVHLEGTTCDKWNKSAIAVFVEDFLRAHPEYPFEEPAVREMVRIKSRATLDSAIRKYRHSLVSRSAQAAEEMRKQKNRQERKRKVSFPASTHSTRIVTSRASSIIAAVKLQRSIRLSRPIVSFWDSSRWMGCPATRNESWDFTLSTISSSLSGGLISSRPGSGSSTPSIHRQGYVDYLETSTVLPLACG